MCRNGHNRWAEPLALVIQLGHLDLEVPDPQHEEVMNKVQVTLLNDKREWFCPTIVTVTAHEM